jgi:tetratricopeptide (TPR) repeat protein
MAEVANSAALVLAADALMEQGRYMEAEPELRQAIEADPSDASAFLALGKCLGATHDVRGSEDCYRQALQLNPDDPDAGNALGLLLWRARGDLKGAEAAFRAVVAANPKVSAAKINLDRLMRMKLPSKGSYRQRPRRSRKNAPRPSTASDRHQKNRSISSRRALLKGATEQAPLEPLRPGKRPTTSTKQPGHWSGFRTDDFLPGESVELNMMSNVEGLDEALPNPMKVLAMLHPALRPTTAPSYDFRRDRSAYLKSRALPKRLQNDFVHLSQKTAPRDVRTRQMARRAKTPSSMLGQLPQYDKWKPSGYVDPFRISFAQPYRRSHAFAMWTAPPGATRRRRPGADFDDDMHVTEKIVGFPDGKEGCELFAVGDEESVAYELREDGKATGEVRVVCGDDTTDVPPDVYEATGYENVGELSWDDKAALGALLACMQLDGDDIEPPYPEDEPIYEMGERPEGLAGQVMDELDAEK